MNIFYIHFRHFALVRGDISDIQPVNEIWKKILIKRTIFAASEQKLKIDTIGRFPAKFSKVTHNLKSGCIFWRLADLLSKKYIEFQLNGLALTPVQFIIHDLCLGFWIKF